MGNRGDSWSDYWSNDGATGEVFVTGCGTKSPALATYWQRRFGVLGKAARVIDLASGAGSVYAHLRASHGFDLHAVDASRDALEMLKQKVPGTTTLVCSIDQLPYRDGAFDLVVSQFGIEYAGTAAFMEAARLVASGGSLAALCHYKDGHIDSNNRPLLAGALTAKRSAFIDRAIELTAAAFSNDNIANKPLLDNFQTAEVQLAAATRKHQTGVHAHLYHGFRQLYEQRRAYSKADITNWLRGMRAEVDKSIERLTLMCDAALSQEDMGKICDRLRTLGLTSVSCSPFRSRSNELPVAVEPLRYSSMNASLKVCSLRTPGLQQHRLTAPS